MSLERYILIALSVLPTVLLLLLFSRLNLENPDLFIGDTIKFNGNLIFWWRFSPLRGHLAKAIEILDLPNNCAMIVLELNDSLSLDDCAGKYLTLTLAPRSDHGLTLSESCIVELSETPPTLSPWGATTHGTIIGKNVTYRRVRRV